MCDDAKQRLAALRLGSIMRTSSAAASLEQQGSALRETLLRISGAIQILEELLANQEPRDQKHQSDTATLHAP